MKISQRFSGPKWDFKSNILAALANKHLENRDSGKTSRTFFEIGDFSRTIIALAGTN
jgi:hypothetical protein